MEMRNILSCCVAVSLVLLSSAGFAGEVDVMAVEAKRSQDGSYGFSVTLRHGDTGWEHYANRWEVLSPDGKVLATRVLHHPHVNEQPFTRSLSHVQIPVGLHEVVIRGHDKVHAYGGKTYAVKLK